MSAGWTSQHADTDVLEIYVNPFGAPARWDRVTESEFRSWTGERRVNGEPYYGDVYWSGTDQVKLVHLWPCGCLINDAGAHRVGCPDHPEGVQG